MLSIKLVAADACRTESRHSRRVSHAVGDYSAVTAHVPPKLTGPAATE
jgi:hypothetical protein